jgi:hypothetical protein
LRGGTAASRSESAIRDAPGRRRQFKLASLGAFAIDRRLAHIAADLDGNPFASEAARIAPEWGDLCAATRVAGRLTDTRQVAA